ncbi:MAG: hypothetical protein QM487_14260 [Candidatus Marithrix sp.]
MLIFLGEIESNISDLAVNSALKLYPLKLRIETRMEVNEEVKDE